MAMSAYVRELNCELERSLQQRQPAPSPLRIRLLEWLSGLPEVTRKRPYAMVEFENALGTQGKYISPVLLELGWQRKRKWSSSGQYHRYWVPD
jgi:hypothetical protein